MTQPQQGYLLQGLNPSGVPTTLSVDVNGNLNTVGGDGVTSAFGRSGAVVATTGDYTVAKVTGAAPLVSPTFTGVPLAPTAAPATNTTQLATTAYADAAVAVETAARTGAGYAVEVATPATASSAGTAGQISYDATHIYVCVSTNVWVRATLASF